MQFSNNVVAFVLVRASQHLEFVRFSTQRSRSNPISCPGVDEDDAVMGAACAAPDLSAAHLTFADASHIKQDEGKSDCSCFSFYVFFCFFFFLFFFVAPRVFASLQSRSYRQQVFTVICLFDPIRTVSRLESMDHIGIRPWPYVPTDLFLPA